MDGVLSCDLKVSEDVKNHAQFRVLSTSNLILSMSSLLPLQQGRDSGKTKTGSSWESGSISQHRQPHKGLG